MATATKTQADDVRTAEIQVTLDRYALWTLRVQRILQNYPMSDEACRQASNALGEMVARKVREPAAEV